MDYVNVLNKNDPHQRTIIHLDMDCYYAQVEEIRDPTLKEHPLGIQQKNFVVTCNYVARAKGITKLMLISEAQRLCPDLVLVNGENLTPYRQMSQKIFELLLNYTPIVEKLGFDENFMDITALVDMRLSQRSKNSDDVEMHTVVGHIYPANDSTTALNCDCGCTTRLAIGSQVAQEIRDELLFRLNITCCAGISYNKLLAKLVGGRNKPNQQTVLVSTYAEQFMRELKDLERITGIGQKTRKLLFESSITNIEQLQLCDMEILRKKFGFETATKLKDWAFGRDTSTVQPTGKPKTLSTEDACRPISVLVEVEDKFRLLLMRLVEQVAEDGRIPIVVKVVLRKFDSQKKTSHRETRQSNILPSLFKAANASETSNNKVRLADGAQDKLLKIIMRLFERIVDLRKPFNITLIGLAFSKFQERKIGNASIANFLIKKTDLEVQSITSLTNTNCPSPTTDNSNSSFNTSGSFSGWTEAFRSSPTTFKPSDQFYRRRAATASPVPMLLDNGSESGATNSDFSDFSETEVEPSPKKSRMSRLLLSAKRSRLADNDADLAAEVASPSKLRVCDLRLNSRDSEKDFPISPIAVTPSTSGLKTINVTASKFRTIQPTNTLLSRLESGGRRFITATRTRTASRLSSNASSTPSSPLPSPMDDSGSAPSTPTSSTVTPIAIESSEQHTVKVKSSCNLLATVPCPAGVDPQVFSELPADVQNELINSWRSSLAAAVAVASSTTELKPSSSVNAASAEQSSSSNSITTKAGGGGSTANSNNRTQKNTIYRYFLRNK